MSKVLFVATVVKAHIMHFHIPYLKMFKEMGWETAVAARNDYEKPEDCVIPYCDNYYHVPFERAPIKPNNIASYKQLKKIIDENKYDIVHCHTPVGALLARLAAIRARKNGTRVIYTAHGFHFYKGAPLLNWLLFFPVEWVCSFLTDTLITINQEDYAFATKHMHARQIEYVPGVGVDLNTFGALKAKPNEMRKILGIPNDKVWILNVAELIPRKNQASLIKAIVDIPEVFLTIAGRGELQEQLTSLIVDLNLEDRVKLLGYRNDVSDLCQSADVFALPSFQEGLSVALIEAMASGLPCVVSRIRGNVDLIDENGGELFDPHCCDECSAAIIRIIDRRGEPLGAYNKSKMVKFSTDSILPKMRYIYS